MKRALLALIMLMTLGRVASVASAEVVELPTIQRMCGRADTWNHMTKCLARFGKATIALDQDGVRLVRVVGTPSESWGIAGVYVFAQSGAKWALIGGQSLDGSYDILALSKLTIRKRAAYRVDIGAVEHQATVDGGDALVRRKLVLVCGDTDFFVCIPLTVSCDAIVDGIPRESFRGTLTIHDDKASIAGDRVAIQSYCAGAGGDINL
jgi:hypothetical protein